MIVPMKHLTLLCVAKEGEKALEALRDLGCVHVDFSGAASAAFAEAKGALADAERAVRVLAKAAKEASAEAADARFEAVRNADLVKAVLKAEAERQALVDTAEALRQTVRKYEPYGDFDPALAKSLLDRGIDLASVVDLPDPLPAERLSETRRKLAEAEAAATAIQCALAALNHRARAILDRYPELRDRMAFAAARDALATQGVVSWIEGWVPQDAVPKVRAKAVTKAWGILLRDAEPGEDPPTLVRPPRMFRSVAVLFAGLGIAPAYTESDVSVPFMCYFSLFFAMLVGDGAYGAIFLAATLFGWWKMRPKGEAGHRPRAVRSWLTLLTVFSSATVVWGVLSNTWFGAGIPWCRDWPTVRWLADPSYNNMMLLCFTIGVSHLMLARLWNGVCKWPDSTALAEFGWAGILLTMYLVTNTIVKIFPAFPAWVLGGRHLDRPRVPLHGQAVRTEGAWRGTGHAAAQHHKRAGGRHFVRAPLRGGARLGEGGGELQHDGVGRRARRARLVDLRAPRGGDGRDPARGARAQPRDGGAFDPRPRRASEHAGVLEPQGRLVVGACVPALPPGECAALG